MKTTRELLLETIREKLQSTRVIAQQLKNHAAELDVCLEKAQTNIKLCDERGVNAMDTDNTVNQFRVEGSKVLIELCAATLVLISEHTWEPSAKPAKPMNENNPEEGEKNENN